MLSDFYFEKHFKPALNQKFQPCWQVSNMIMTAAIQAREVEPVCATDHKPAVCSCKEIWKRIGLHWLQHKQPGTTGVVRLYVHPVIDLPSSVQAEYQQTREYSTRAPECLGA